MSVVFWSASSGGSPQKEMSRSVIIDGAADGLYEAFLRPEGKFLGPPEGLWVTEERTDGLLAS